MDSYNLINCGDNKRELIMGRLSYDECLRLIRFMCQFVEKQSHSNITITLLTIELHLISITLTVMPV